MSIPPIIVKTAKSIWNLQWKLLMNGLGPSDSKGNYKRPFNNQPDPIIPSKEDLQERDVDQYPCLIVGKSCPWAHRAWMVYEMKGLKNSINLHIAQVDNENGRWIFNPPLKGAETLMEVYQRCGNNKTERATVPILFDPGKESDSKPRLINNESAQIVEILDNWPISNKTLELNPEHYREEILKWQELIQENINNGVYKCGFARNQTAYENASKDLFSSLSIVEENLHLKGPWLCGKDLTIADIRLFPTMIRWESVYEPLFKCSKRQIQSFPNIIKWRKMIFNSYNIKETCDADAWRKDYYGALFPLNPSSIIPKGESISKIVNQ